MNESEFDLNLFKTFKAIYQTKSISKAALKLNVSQPTTSKNLIKLRNCFNDPLFVYSGKGMIPTEVAEQMYQTVLDGVNSLEGTLFQNQKFNPQLGDHLFRIGMSDYSETILLPKLLQYIKGKQANVRIDVEHLYLEKRHEALEEGFTDINIHGSIQGIHQQRYGKNIMQQFLYEDRYVFVMGKQFAPQKKMISLKELSALDHARYGISLIIDKLLLDHQLKRKVVLQVPHILVLPQIITKNNLVATLPNRLAIYFAKQLPLQILESPLPLPPLKFHMYWQERKKESLAHVWLRDTLKEIMKSERHSSYP